MTRALGAGLVVVALVGAAVIGSQLQGPAPVVSEPPPDTPRVHPDATHLVIVSIDTLRADALGTYGNPVVRSPAIDAFASEAVVFEHHISSAPTTLASHTALFTGTAPHTHGVPRNDYIVPDSNRMLPELLVAHGWSTAAFLGAVPIASHSNWTQGFEHVDEDFDRHRDHGVVSQTQRDGVDVTNATLSWLDARDDDRPLFLFVHYFDVHAPYEPPAEFREGYEIDPSIPKAGTMRHLDKVRRMRPGPTRDKHVRTLENLYLAGVTWTDAEVGRLLDGLRTRGILDDAVVILTSDHGETYAAHEEVFNHGATVYDETIRTPFIVRFPGGWRGGSRVSEVVSNIDVTPTLLDLWDLPREPVEGRSVRTLLSGQEGWTPRPAFAEATKPHVGKQAGWHNDPMDKAIRTETAKLILSPRRADRVERFDLVADPAEANPLPSDPALRSQLDAWRAQADPKPASRDSSARRTAELSALGYVE
jgi:arylsulfatase A-like enzyme